MRNEEELYLFLPTNAVATTKEKSSMWNNYWVCASRLNWALQTHHI